MSNSNPIGVFDSGIGGLSVLREIRALLPHEDLIYVADSGNAPYGDRSSEFIAARSSAIVGFLNQQNVKAIVVACNTATCIGVPLIREQITMPLIAMEPAIKPAVERTKSKVIGVLATSRTISSNSVKRLMTRFGEQAQIVLQPCPGLVECVEAGNLLLSETHLLIERYIRPLIDQGADMIVLGCTHYPFLTPIINKVIQESTDRKIDIIDSGAAVAREVKRRLSMIDELTASTALGKDDFYTTGAIERVGPVVSMLWTNEVQTQLLAKEYCLSHSIA